MTLIELIQLYPSLPPEEQLKVQYALNPQQRKALQQYLSLAGAAEQTKAQEEEKAQAEADRKRQEQMSNPLYQVGVAGSGALATGLGMGVGQAIAGSGAGAGAGAAAAKIPAGGLSQALAVDNPFPAGFVTDASGAPVGTAAGESGISTAAAPAAEQGGMLSSLWGSGGSSTGGSGYLGMTGANPLLGSAGILAGGATGYEQFKGLENAAKGKDMSFLEETALALPTFGMSYAWNPIKNAFGLGDGNKWQTEGNRLGDLNDNGVYLPDNWKELTPQHGRSFDEMQNKNYADDYIGRDAQGNWVNNKFNQSRDVKDLRGEDIVNYATFAEHDPEWFKKPLDQRLGIANDLLGQGLVSEGHGSVDVNWDKYNPTAAASTPAAASGGGVPAKGTRLSPGVYADGKGGVYYAKSGLMALGS